jgi:hypothetical protein
LFHVLALDTGNERERNDHGAAHIVPGVYDDADPIICKEEILEHK